MFPIFGYVLAGEGKDVVEQAPVTGTEAVVGFLVLALGEHRVGFQVMPDVAAATLHEVSRKPAANAFTPGPVQVRRQVGEVPVEQPQQRAERLLVTAVRRRSHQEDVSSRIGRHAAQQIVTLLAPPARASGEGTAMGFVDDHELRAAMREVLRPLRLLDEVGRHHGERVPFEHRLAHVQVAFQALDGARQYEFGFDVELLCQLPLPLLGQRRRAEHRHAVDLAAIEQLSCDQAGFDGLADAHVVGNQHAHRIELQGHHEGNKLVGPGLDGDAPEAAKRPGGRPGREPSRVAEQSAGREVPEVLSGREPERRRLDRLHRRQNPGYFLVEPAHRAEHEQLVRRVGQHQPFAPACVDEGAGLGKTLRVHVASIGPTAPGADHWPTSLGT